MEYNFNKDVIKMQERKKEILEASLECFIKNGLNKTSINVLIDAIQVPRSLVYYYFTSKDELVMACAEECAKRLEESMMAVAFKHIDDLETMEAELRKSAELHAPMMKFLVSVAVSKNYADRIKPAIASFSSRYDLYSEQVAKKLGCDIKDATPIVYIAIIAVTNYMIFGEESLLHPQFEYIKKELAKLATRKIIY